MVKLLIRVVVAAFVAVSIVGVIGAVLARRRIVPSTDPDADEIVLAAIFGPLENDRRQRRLRWFRHHVGGG
jgi:H+/Cl- antiporter ClcA